MLGGYKSQDFIVHCKPKFSMFVQNLKLSILFLKNNVGILK